MGSQSRAEQLLLFATPTQPQLAPPIAEPPPAVFPCFESSVVALGLLRGVGHNTVKALVDAFDGDLSRIWKAAPDLLNELFTKARTPSASSIASRIEEAGDDLWDAGKRSLNELRSRSISVIQRNLLPPRLRDIHDDPPRWLFVQGEAEVLNRSPFVAVVGTRSPSPEGLEATRRICKVLARYPSITLVSGLADGIDGEAHTASLLNGTRNLAFLGHGINLTFPSSTADLREEIVRKGGAVATEYLPDEKFQKAYFVRRNRLQAALADLVIPVEAQSKSGTAHTVAFAKSYKRNMVGMRWKGSSGVAEDLERDGYPVLDIFEDSGVRMLDAMFRSLAEGAEGESYAFAQTEKLFAKELKTRLVKVKDLDRLIRAIESAYRELGEEWPLPESSSIIPSSSDNNPPR